MYKYANAMYAIRNENEKKRAVFFAKIKFTTETREIFINVKIYKIIKYYSQNKFNSVPNLIITQPKISNLDEIQRPMYLRDFTWQISTTDGQVTASKLLEFINKKTLRNVIKNK